MASGAPWRWLPIPCPAAFAAADGGAGAEKPADDCIQNTAAHQARTVAGIAAVVANPFSHAPAATSTFVSATSRIESAKDDAEQTQGSDYDGDLELIVGAHVDDPEHEAQDAEGGSQQALPENSTSCDQAAPSGAARIAAPRTDPVRSNGRINPKLKHEYDYANYNQAAET